LYHTNGGVREKNETTGSMKATVSCRLFHLVCKSRVSGGALKFRPNPIPDTTSGVFVKFDEGSRKRKSIELSAVLPSK